MLDVQGQPADDQITQRLTAFCRAHTADPRALVRDIAALPGHAGLSFKFLLEFRNRGKLRQESLVIRMAPPGVRPVGPADVARQGRIMASLGHSEIPVPPVRWFGDDARWFGVPYCVVSFVGKPGSRRGDEALDSRNAAPRARAALSAMAKLHALKWSAVKAAWGDPVPARAQLARLDALLRRPSLDPALVRASTPLSRRLWASVVEAPPIGCIHGDFQWTNLLFDGQRLLAVLDWELAGVGPTPLDLAWLCLFCDSASWSTTMLVPSAAPKPPEVVALYQEITGRPLKAPLVDWFRALAAYRFGAITIFNLMLHRRGKRVDPAWEVLALSVAPMFSRALELCS